MCHKYAIDPVDAVSLVVFIVAFVKMGVKGVVFSYLIIFLWLVSALNLSEEHFFLVPSLIRRYTFGPFSGIFGIWGRDVLRFTSVSAPNYFPMENKIQIADYGTYAVEDKL